MPPTLTTTVAPHDVIDAIHQLRDDVLGPTESRPSVEEIAIRLDLIAASVLAVTGSSEVPIGSDPTYPSSMSEEGAAALTRRGLSAWDRDEPAARRRLGS